MTLNILLPFWQPKLPPKNTQELLQGTPKTKIQPISFSLYLKLREKHSFYPSFHVKIAENSILVYINRSFKPTFQTKPQQSALQKKTRHASAASLKQSLNSVTN